VYKNKGVEKIPTVKNSGVFTKTSVFTKNRCFSNGAVKNKFFPNEFFTQVL